MSTLSIRGGTESLCNCLGGARRKEEERGAGSALKLDVVVQDGSASSQQRNEASETARSMVQSQLEKTCPSISYGRFLAPEGG